MAAVSMRSNRALGRNVLSLRNREEVRAYCRHNYIPAQRAEDVDVALRLTKGASWYYRAAMSAVALQGARADICDRAVNHLRRSCCRQNRPVRRGSTE